MNAYQYGAVMGSILFGLAIGAIPLTMATKKGKSGLGVAALLCCIVGSFFAGLLLSVPICAIFVWIIQANKSEPNQ